MSSELFSHASRWRNLTISSRDREGLGCIVGRLQNTCVPLLEHLQIEVEFREENAWPTVPIVLHRVFSTVPSLRVVQIKGSGLQNCLPPLHNISILHIHGTLFSSCVLPVDRQGMFKDLLNLAELAIHGPMTVFNTGTSSPPLQVNFPCLRTLALLATKGHPPDVALIRYFHAPLLERLMLEQLKGWEMEYMPMLFERRGEPFPSLRELTVVPCSAHVGWIGEEHWMGLAIIFPSVTTLKVLQSNNALFIETLYSEGSQMPPWPNLQTLGLVASEQTVYMPLALLHNRLMRRASMGYPMKRVCFTGHALSSMKLDPEYRAMVADSALDIGEFHSNRWPPVYEDWYEKE